MNLMGKYDLFIFDLDGTVIDSTSLMKKSLQYALEGTHYTVQYKNFFSRMGDSLENIFKELEIPLELTRNYREYSQMHIKEIKAFLEVIECIKVLKSNGKTVVIFTGKDLKRTEEILRHLNIIEMFDDIVTPDVVLPKPSPQGINLLINKFQVSSERTIMFGDSKIDLLSAKEANVDFSFVTWGVGDIQEIKYLKPTYVVYDQRNLLKTKDIQYV